MKLSVCPYKIQNFQNSVADISVPGQLQGYLEFRGEKYKNIFIMTNANDCPNLLSYSATFRMGVLLTNYPQSIVVQGENVPCCGKVNGDGLGLSSETKASNVFQIFREI